MLTRNEVIGENWFMDIAKDVMHNMGKDLHVNVAADIFYTGGATYQLKLAKDFSAKAGGDVGIDFGGKTPLKSKGDIAVESSMGKLTFKAATTFAVEAGMSITLKAGLVLHQHRPGRRRHRRHDGQDQFGRLRRLRAGGLAERADRGEEAGRLDHGPRRPPTTRNSRIRSRRSDHPAGSRRRWPPPFPIPS